MSAKTSDVRISFHTAADMTACVIEPLTGRAESWLATPGNLPLPVSQCYVAQGEYAVLACRADGIIGSMLADGLIVSCGETGETEVAYTNTPRYAR